MATNLTEIKYLDQDRALFLYDRHEDALICAYCQKRYSFNNETVRTALMRVIESKEAMPNVICRCIRCALDNDQYPLRFNYDGWVPNQEQKDVILELYQQMLITSHDNYTNYVFLLEGEAGTGKTSTIMLLFKLEEFNRFKICFASPTNKALNVMMEKFADETTDTHLDETSVSRDNETDDDIDKTDKVNYQFMTVFKLTDSKVSINETGETIFEKGNEMETTHHFDIIVIDEVSMIEKSSIRTFVEFGQTDIPSIIYDFNGRSWSITTCIG